MPFMLHSGFIEGNILTSCLEKRRREPTSDEPFPKKQRTSGTMPPKLGLFGRLKELSTFCLSHPELLIPLLRIFGFLATSSPKDELCTHFEVLFSQEHLLRGCLAPQQSPTEQGKKVHLMTLELLLSLARNRTILSLLRDTVSFNEKAKPKSVSLLKGVILLLGKHSLGNDTLTRKIRRAAVHLLSLAVFMSAEAQQLPQATVTKVLPPLVTLLYEEIQLARQPNPTEERYGT